MRTDWIARWLLICGVALVDALWLWLDGISVDIGSLGPRLHTASLFLAGSLASMMLSLWLRPLPKPLGIGADFLYSVTQFLLLLPTTLALTYLAATVDAPLVDDALLRADRLIGFDWQAFNDWIATRPSLWMLLRMIYSTIFIQTLLVMLIGSISRPGERNSEFFWIFAVSLILCSLMSAALPALGYDGAIGPAHVEALKQVRAGQWTTLSYQRIDGIITFPSFHATLAVMFAYSVRKIPFAFGVLAPLNVLMLLSTPTIGGHYLVDIIAGVALAAVAIAIVALIRRATLAAPLIGRPFWFRPIPTGEDSVSP
jgi:hypothetical protein